MDTGEQMHSEKKGSLAGYDVERARNSNRCERRSTGFEGEREVER